MTMIRSWLPAVVVLALAGLLLVVDAGLLAQGWLVASLTCGALPLGAMAILLAHNLTGGRWGESSHPLWRAQVATTPLFVASMIILLAGMESLFSWTGPTESLPELVQNKRFYLNEPFFMVRMALYAVMWLALAAMLTGWPRGRQPPRGIGAPGLILWMLALTFFGFDWVISLEPTFYTDVFGFMFALQVTAAAMAVVILVMAGRLGSPSSPGPLRDLANLWLGLLLGWVFMAFSQYIIIWSGNLPDEIAWYLHRSEGLWRPVSVVSFVLFFLLPFCILLSGAAKGRRHWLMAAAIMCLAGHVLQVAWLVLPAFPHRQAWEYVLVAALILALGAGYRTLARACLARMPSPSRQGAGDSERRPHVRT